MTVVECPATLLYLKQPNSLIGSEHAMDNVGDGLLEHGAGFRRNRRWRLRLIACIAMSAVSGSGGAHEITCTPDSRLECSGINCSWTTSEFQHAEFYLVDDALGTLGACLWTNCFAGKASYEDGYPSGARVATALLQPVNDMPGYAPILVSLSHDMSGRFSSALIDGIDLLVLSFGRCANAADESSD
jgi:hypothetical protein